SMPIRRNRVMTADVGDEIWLAPPRTARIAGPEPGQDGEDESQRQRNRHASHESLADIGDEGDQLLTHVMITSRFRFGMSGVPLRGVNRARTQAADIEDAH